MGLMQFVVGQFRSFRSLRSWAEWRRRTGTHHRGVERSSSVHAVLARPRAIPDVARVCAVRLGAGVGQRRLKRIRIWRGMAEAHTSVS